MDEKTIREVFPTRLTYYMRINGKKRNDLVRDLGFKYSTIRDWEKGLTVPRMDKVELLSRYFGCNNSDLIEDKKEEPVIKDELTQRKEKFIERIMLMSEEELDRLDQILRIVEGTK